MTARGEWVWCHFTNGSRETAVRECMEDAMSYLEPGTKFDVWAKQTPRPEGIAVDFGRSRETKEDMAAGWGVVWRECDPSRGCVEEGHEHPLMGLVLITQAYVPDRGDAVTRNMLFEKAERVVAGLDRDDVWYPDPPFEADRVVKGRAVDVGQLPPMAYPEE